MNMLRFFHRNWKRQAMVCIILHSVNLFLCAESQSEAVDTDEKSHSHSNSVYSIALKNRDLQWVRDELEKFRANHDCDACAGKRLKAESLAVKIDMHDISDVARLSIGEARDWFSGLGTRLEGQQSEIAARILKEINERLGFLVNVDETVVE